MKRFQLLTAFKYSTFIFRCIQYHHNKVRPVHSYWVELQRKDRRLMLSYSFDINSFFLLYVSLKLLVLSFHQIFPPVGEFYPSVITEFSIPPSTFSCHVNVRQQMTFHFDRNCILHVKTQLILNFLSSQLNLEFIVG